jgi:hypothetical protein
VGSETLGNLTGYILLISRPTQALKFTAASLQSSTDYERRYVVVSYSLGYILPLLATLGDVLTWFVPTWINGLPLSMYRIVHGCRIADG